MRLVVVGTQANKGAMLLELVEGVADSTEQSAEGAGLPCDEYHLRIPQIRTLAVGWRSWSLRLLERGPLERTVWSLSDYDNAWQEDPNLLQPRTNRQESLHHSIEEHPWS